MFAVAASQTNVFEPALAILAENGTGLAEIVFFTNVGIAFVSVVVVVVVVVVVGIIVSADVWGAVMVVGVVVAVVGAIATAVVAVVAGKKTT